MNFLNYIKCSFDIANILKTNNQIKNDIVDPFSIIVLLGVLSYYPIGTKIAIHNNRLYIQLNNILQGIERYYYGDKKTDINILFCPILYAIKKYINSNDNKFIFIFKRALIGLNNLKKTYTTQDIVYSINRLIDLINYGITNEKNFLNDNDFEFTKIDKIKNNIYDEFNTVWTEDNFNIIIKLFNQLENKINDNNFNKNYNLLYTIENYIRSTESELIDKLNNII